MTAPGKNGKTNTKLLPEPDFSRALNIPIEKPVTEMEKLLSKGVSSVLGIEESTFGMGHSFFKIGGDSISAMRLSSYVRRMEASLPVAPIMSLKVLRKIAGAIELQAAEILANQSEIVGDVPLTPIQLWFTGMHNAGMVNNIHHFTQSMHLKLLQPVEYSDLQAAFDEIFRSHDMLRARQAVTLLEINNLGLSDAFNVHSFPDEILGTELLRQVSYRRARICATRFTVT